MTPSEKSLSQILQIEGNQEHYLVPKYQRPYSWGKDHWDDLLRDIEDDANHFMGSIICVPRDADTRSPGEEFWYEVIDGQQRLVTLSLLLCAISTKLDELSPEQGASEEVKGAHLLTRSGVRKKLIREKSKNALSPRETPVEEAKATAYFARVVPSTQSHNLEDYLYVLVLSGLLKKAQCPSHWGNRRIAKCFEHFKRNLPTDPSKLGALIERVNNLRFIHISVPSQADAYRLFEALNNRGQPLSALDIIKNSLLSSIEQKKRGSIDDAFESWKAMIERLTDDEAIQERYLRHYYNAFRRRADVGVKGYPRATRSTIIRIYDSLAKTSAQGLLDGLHGGSVLYQKLVDPENSKLSKKRRAIFVDLDRISAAPAYQGLLYLLDAEDKGKLKDSDTLDEIAAFIAKYFIRRNVTDQPSTNRLDPLFAELIEACESELDSGRKLSADYVIERLKKHKTDKPADDKTFREMLLDSLWWYSDSMARYVLCRLDESFATREYAPDLWKRDERGKYVWTVEHVLPQAERLRKEWVAMVADGDSGKAVEVQEAWVHCLGNLTLSAYNSRLSDKAFADKRETHEVTVAGDRLQIGYKNGLALNKLPFVVGDKETSLAKTKVWTADEIQSRNKAIVDRLMKMFAL